MSIGVEQSSLNYLGIGVNESEKCYDKFLRSEWVLIPNFTLKKYPNS